MRFRGLVIISSLVVCPACGDPSPVSSLDTQVEGSRDDEVRYSDREALPSPETLGTETDEADYLLAIEQGLQPAWSSFLEDCRVRLKASHPLNKSTLVVDVVLVVAADGTLAEARVDVPSGNLEFDIAALEIASAHTVLPAPPAGKLSDDGRLYLRWRFARDRRQAGSSEATWLSVKLPLGEAIAVFLKSGRVRDAAVRMAETHPSIEVQVRLLSAIAAAIVEEALGGSDSQRQAVALKAVRIAKLGEFLSEVRRAASSSESAVASAALAALGAIGSASDRPLLESRIHGPSSSPILAHAAASSLATLGFSKIAGELVMGDLEGTSKKQRKAALVVFSVIKDARSVPALVSVLYGRSKAAREERIAAATALGNQAGGSSLALKALMRGSAQEDAAVRAACVLAIASAAKAGHKSRAAYWTVLEHLKDRDERVRAAAIDAAVALDARRFSQELREIRKSRTTLVSRRIALSLASVPGPTALARLLALSRQEDLETRLAAIRSLSFRSEPEARAEIVRLEADPEEDIRLAALKGEDWSSQQTHSWISDKLLDSSPRARSTVLRLLIRAQGQQRAASFSIDLLALPTTSTLGQMRWATAWLSEGR